MSPRWSLETAKWLVTTLAIPVVLGAISYRYEHAQTERQATDARLRLYTELLSKREEADTGVRRGVFDKVLENYLKPDVQDLDSKLVALELLALNFNESLDLSPLFWQFDREIQQRAAPDKRPGLTAQLLRITAEVKDRQAAALETVGVTKDVKVNLEELHNASGKAIDADLSFRDPDPLTPNAPVLKRHFSLEVAEHDPARRRVMVFVTHTGADGTDTMASFWVDVFDFPLVNFSRISKSERFTVLLKRYNPPMAELALIYFPSFRSGVRDKPFIDEVIADLRRATR